MSIVKSEFKNGNNSVIKELHLLIEEFNEKYGINLLEDNDIYTEREWYIVSKLYRFGESPSAIAANMGYTPTNVRSVIEHLVKKVKKELRARDPETPQSKEIREIANKLVLIRNRRGYTMKEVQEALSLNAKTLSSIENGEVIVEDQLLLRFCELYNVYFDWLKGQTIHPEVDKAGVGRFINEISQLDRGLLHALSLLNKDDQELIKDLVVRLKSYTGHPGIPNANRAFNQVQNTETIDEIMAITIEDLDLTVRSYNCLKRGGINTIHDITERTEEDLLKIRNMGRKSFEEIVDKLKHYGIRMN